MQNISLMEVSELSLFSKDQNYTDTTWRHEVWKHAVTGYLSSSSTQYSSTYHNTILPFSSVNFACCIIVHTSCVYMHCIKNV